VGIVRPAYCTAIGKVLLSALPKGELDAYLRRAPFEAYTPKTITTPAALREEIERVAATGTAYDDAEFNHELRCIAAPVRNFTNRPSRRSDLRSRMARNPERHAAAEYTRRLMADDLSRDLGFRARTKNPTSAQPRQASWILNHGCTGSEPRRTRRKCKRKENGSIEIHRLMICINRHPVCRTLSGRIRNFHI